MTDPYNTAPFEDRQSKNLLNVVVAGDLIDSALKARSKPNKFKATTSKTEDYVYKSKLYQDGIKHFRERGIYLMVDRTGVHCGHHIYLHKSPPPIKGVNYDGNFMPKMPLVNIEDFARLEAAVNSMGQMQRDFWEPIIHPKTDSELSRYVERLIAMQKISNNYSAQEPKNYYQTHDPSPNGVFGKASNHPMSWIPAKEWFSENIRNNLRFEDVFTIFPQAEIDIIKLWLGRVAVGPSNHIPDNHDSPIRHTARMGIVIVGKNAGLGKSTLFNYLLNALNKCGHSTTTFRSVQDKFGLKNGALSSVLYKDDVSDSTLQAFLSAEETKILISNGLILSEDKFVHAETITPRCSILINSNSWSANMAYALDSGIQSRIKTLSTYSNIEMQRLRQTIGGISGDSPDLRPYYHIPFLAKKLDCDPEALFLWCARIAADEFYQLITDESEPQVNRLEERVNYLTSRLRYRFKSDVLSAIVQCMALCKIIVDKLSGNMQYLPEFNLRIFYHLCKHFYFFGVDPSTQFFTQCLREDWENKGRITSHPYQSFRDVRFDTFKQSLDWIEENYVSQLNSNLTLNQDESSVLKKFTTFLMMRDGFKLSGSIPLFIESWNGVRYQYGDLSSLADSILSRISEEHPEDLKRIQAYSLGKVKVEDDWMNNMNYSPDIAQKLRIQSKQSKL